MKVAIGTVWVSLYTGFQDSSTRSWRQFHRKVKIFISRGGDWERQECHNFSCFYGQLVHFWYYRESTKVENYSGRLLEDFGVSFSDGGGGTSFSFIWSSLNDASTRKFMDLLLFWENISFLIFRRLLITVRDSRFWGYFFLNRRIGDQ